MLTKVVSLPSGSILEIVLPPKFAQYKLPEISNANPTGLTNPLTKGVLLPLGVILEILLSV